MNKEKTTEIALIDGSIAIVKDTEFYKALKSENYNFYFNKDNGFFARWGKGDYTDFKKEPTKDELQLYLVWASIWKEKFNVKKFVADLQSDGSEENGILEIVDIEITSVPCKTICSFCYKNNNINGKNMTIETYSKILPKLHTITQVAFGITDIDANPDMWDIFKHTRENGIVPNVTINCKRMTKEYYDNLAKYCGAVACSYYNDDECFNSVKELTDRGMTQVNIHHMIHADNFDETIELFKKRLTDSRLEKLNAIVLLSMKPVGLAKTKYKKLSQEKFKELTLFALENNIGVGYDSCGSYKFLQSIKDIEKYNELETYVEKCESSIYSGYINSSGNFSYCSFLDDKEQGLSVVDCNNFYNEIWFDERTKKFREKAINGRKSNRGCSVYDI